ncbi:hypothetical protein ACFX13_019134 [Malus domestica]
MTYLDEHEEMTRREHPSHLYAKKHRELFPQWFLEYVNKLKASNSTTYSEELYNLAFSPIRVELFSGCHVNSVKFLGTARDDKLCTGFPKGLALWAKIESFSFLTPPSLLR